MHLVNIKLNRCITAAQGNLFFLSSVSGRFCSSKFSEQPHVYPSAQQNQITIFNSRNRKNRQETVGKKNLSHGVGRLMKTREIGVEKH